MAEASLRIIAAGEASVGDDAIERLLHDVYVVGGFTAHEVAATIFAAAAVRARGELQAAFDDAGRFVGMVVVVPADAPGRRFAADDEAEMHLLAVHPEARGRGTGRLLIEAAKRRAFDLGFARMILWTQPTMSAAHRLYQAAGFERVASRDFESGGKPYWFYAADLTGARAG